MAEGTQEARTFKTWWARFIARYKRDHGGALPPYRDLVNVPPEFHGHAGRTVRRLKHSEEPEYQPGFPMGVDIPRVKEAKAKDDSTGLVERHVGAWAWR